MLIDKEIVHEQTDEANKIFSAKAIEAAPFRDARVKQGGYGLLGDSFWLKRTDQKGFHVFVLTLSGTGLYRMNDGSEYLAQRGQIFISSASGQGHFERTIDGEKWEMLWISFWDDSEFFIPRTEDYSFSMLDDLGNIPSLFNEVLKEETRQDSRSDEALELVEKLFLLNLSRVLDLTDNKNLSRHRIEFSKLWEKIASSLSFDWSLAAIANELGYSRSHLTRICLELYGRNPGDIVKDMRMRQAKSRLLNSVESVEGIANKVGYQRVSTFSNAFHEYYGISPREFREKNCVPDILKYI